MSRGSRLALSLLPAVIFASSAFSQQTPVPAQSGNSRIYLDVVVTSASGAPVAGLRQQDFTLFDNKAPQPITSFQALGGNDAPVAVTIVEDDVNASFSEVSYERQQIDSFLRANGGHLAYPTAFAILTDGGITIAKNFSSDGKAVSSMLDSYVIPLHIIPRAAGFYAALDRFQLSIEALHKLAARNASPPTRNLILWVSPGWPFLSGPRSADVLDLAQEQRYFNRIIAMSGQLRQARVTLYSIDPLGPSERLGATFYYEGFLKGITKPKQALRGDLGLQVLAVQSGGLALQSSNDIAALLKRCLADTQSYYELSFVPVPDERCGAHHHEYHHIDIMLREPGLSVRTRDGYYSWPRCPTQGP